MPTQHLNLNDPRFAPQRQWLSARQGLLAATALAGLVMLAALGLHALGDRTSAQARQIDADLVPLRAALIKVAAGRTEADLELPALKAVEAGQRRVRTALEAGVAGSREGPAGYLAALARQAPGGVWITGLTLSEDGRSLDLEGRMLDTAQFTDYLRRLNAEPRFKGRPFSQLSLKAAEAASAPAGSTTVASLGPRITDFALRSDATAAAPAAAATATATAGGRP